MIFNVAAGVSSVVPLTVAEHTTTLLLYAGMTGIVKVSTRTSPLSRTNESTTPESSELRFPFSVQEMMASGRSCLHLNLTVWSSALLCS